VVTAVNDVVDALLDGKLNPGHYFVQDYGMFQDFFLIDRLDVAF
jgi:hypothetical protein